MATGSRLRVPVLAFGPLILGLPLLILAVKVLVPSYPFTKSLALAVLCIAILGGVVAAVEHQRLRIPVWTTALEFFFAWFLIYAIYKLNVGHIHRIVAYVPPLAILAGIGAVVSAVLCHRADSQVAQERRRRASAAACLSDLHGDRAGCCRYRLREHALFRCADPAADRPELVTTLAEYSSSLRCWLTCWRRSLRWCAS